MLLPWLLLSISSCQAAPTTSLTRKQVDRIKTSISLARVSSGPALVRLGFHDCVGGCDGCINPNIGDNAGLAKIINKLEKVYKGEGFDKILSRADFWALAAIHGVEKTLGDAQDADVKKEGGGGEDEADRREDGLCAEKYTSNEEQDASSEEKDPLSKEKGASSEKKDASSEETDLSSEEKGASSEGKNASSEEKDASIEEKNASSEEKDTSSKERDALSEEKDASSEEKDASSEENDASSEEKNGSSEERDASIEEKDASSEEKDESSDKHDASSEENYAPSEEQDTSSVEMDAPRKENNSSSEEKSLSRQKELNGNPFIKFRWGRKDCPTSPFTERDVGQPGGTFNHSQVFEFFSREFGFSSPETVALMGVHTLGGAKTKQSGFQGHWVPGPGRHQLNNEYFKRLTNPCLTWRHHDNTGSGKWQWDLPAKETDAFMLNADMAVYRQLRTEEGRATCGPARSAIELDLEVVLTDSATNTSTIWQERPTSPLPSCPPAVTAPIVENFARNNSAWLGAFADVFTKMLEHGDEDLKDVVGDGGEDFKDVAEDGGENTKEVFKDEQVSSLSKLSWFSYLTLFGAKKIFGYFA